MVDYPPPADRFAVSRRTRVVGETAAPSTSRALLRPGRMAPVAIVVQANPSTSSGAPAGPVPADAPLAALGNEARTVADLLHRAGYDVYLQASGLYGDLCALLADRDICNRLVVFHYCGHAERDFVRLTDENGAPMSVSAEALRDQMMGETVALRLVYINGCLSQSQETEYRETFPRVNFIGTKVNIPDWYASGFAIAFYERLVGHEAPFGQTTVAMALRRAAGQDRGKKPARINAVMHVQFARTGDGPQPDLNFHLSEGRGLIGSHVLSMRQYREPRVLMLYCLAVFAFQGVIAWLAHIYTGTSSPAFQAAFSFAPTQAARDAVDCFLNSKLDTSANCTGTGGFALYGLSPFFGFAVEWGRAFILLFCMILIASLLYRRLPRDHPRFLSSEMLRWIMARGHRWFVAVAVVGFCGIVIYHAFLAPAQLANLRSEDLRNATWLQARWPTFLGHAQLWAGFEHRFPDTVATDVMVAEQSMSDPIFFELYTKPYLVYMAYSIGSYLMTALPIAVVIIHGFIFGARHLRLQLEETRIALRLTRDGFHARTGRVGDLLARSRADMSGHFSRFAATALILSLFAAYEVLLGRTTTAFFGQMVAWLVFAMVAMGVLQIVVVWNAYRDTLDTMRTMIHNTADPDTADRLRPFGTAIASAYVPVRPVAIVTGILALTLLSSLIYLLVSPSYGSDWNIYTVSRT